MQRLRVLATILTLAVGREANAQRTSALDSLPIGARVRFRIPDSFGSPASATRRMEVRGNVVKTTDDSLVITLAQTNAVVAVARADVADLAVSHGRRSRLSSAWHAMRPLSPLLAFNAAVLFAAPHSSADRRAALAPLIIGLPVALALPHTIGAAVSPTEHWERLPGVVPR